MDSVAHLGVAHFFKVNSHAFKNIITHRHSATYDSMTQLGVPHCHLVSRFAPLPPSPTPLFYTLPDTLPDTLPPQLTSPKRFHAFWRY